MKNLFFFFLLKNKFFLILSVRCRFDPAVVRTPIVPESQPSTSFLKEETGPSTEHVRNDDGRQSSRKKRGELRGGESGEDEKRQTQLQQQKEWKRRLELGANLFNTEPKRCVKPLQKLGVIADGSAKSLAEFLRNSPGLKVA